MLERATLGVGLVILCACSSASPERAPRAAQTPETAVAPELGSPPSSPAPDAPPDPGFATFIDPDTGQGLQEVHDADREIVFFALQSESMIWAANGNPVGGWVTSGNELFWKRSGGAFRVRFGSEGGARRAYFTEADRGTICNLSISAPEQLSISPTNETPPEP